MYRDRPVIYLVDYFNYAPQESGSRPTGGETKDCEMSEIRLDGWYNFVEAISVIEKERGGAGQHAWALRTATSVTMCNSI